MATAETNLAIFKQLVDHDVPMEGWQDEYRRTHHKDIVVNQPGRTEPIIGVEAHIADIERLVEAFPDIRLEVPHRIIFADGDAMCAINRFWGTMTGVLRLDDGTEFEPTGKKFELTLCAVMVWRGGVMVEENLFYDLASLMTQIGIG